MLKDEEIVDIVNRAISDSVGVTTSELESDQADNLETYLGEPYGDEEAGSSQVVTRDALETVEWILPDLLEQFVGGPPVKWDPTGKEDIDQCKQETLYVNHVIMKENDGFMLFHNWFKDALIEKLGYATPYIKESVEETELLYMNLNDAELADLFDEYPDGEAIEYSMHEEDMEVETPMGLMSQTVALHDIKLKIQEKKKEIKVEIIPQEELKVAKGHTHLSLREAPYVIRQTKKTVSDLIEMGIDKKVVEGLNDVDGRSIGELKAVREQYDTAPEVKDIYDPSEREVNIDIVWIRIDRNEDGISELRRIMKSDETLLEDEAIQFIPVAALCPIPMPHQHIGLSEVDLVKDLQRIRTVLIRQILNNLYLVNNPEKLVIEELVNIDDFLTSIAGGLKRVDDIGAVETLTVPFTAKESLPMLQILDEMRETRTGVSKQTMGMDAETLAQSTQGAFMGAMKEANRRVGMIARIFAETGVKDLFLMIHRLAIEFIDKETRIELNGEYIDLDPSDWQKRTNATVQVGLGAGAREEEIATLSSIKDEQKEHLLNGSPMVRPKHLYNTYELLIEKTGIGNVSQFFDDPGDEPLPQKDPSQDPNVQLQQELIRVEQEKNNIKMQQMQFDLQKKEADMMQKMNQWQMDFEEKVREFNETMEAKYTDMEMKYGQDVVGQGAQHA